MAEVKIHFIKSPACIEMPVHGVYGGVTPQGNISAAIFSERQPIPNEIVYTVNSDGSLGPELVDKRICKENFVRVVQAVLHFDVSMAVSVRDWLTERINEANKVVEKRDAK